MRRTTRALLYLALASTATGVLAAADTALLGGIAAADSETVEARNAADVFAAPGEQSRVVTHVRAGKEMVVLQSKNRWLKVRVNGRTGWITRSNVSTVELSEPAPRAKRRRPFVEGRSTRRGSRGKAPSDRIGGDATDADIDDQAADDDDDDARLKRERKRARLKRKKAQAREMDEEILDEDDAGRGDDDEDDEGARARKDDDDDDEDKDDDEGAGDDDEDKEEEREFVVVKVASAKIYEEADTDSESMGAASEGDKLFVVERDGNWIKVENEDGEAGWVKASKVEDGESGPGYKWEKFAKRARAGLGYESMSQNFTSNGATDPNYKLSSAAAVLGIGGDVLYDYSPTYLIGGDLGYKLAIASPGIRYADDAGNAVNIGFKIHQVDLGVRGGYKLSKKSGMAAYGRLGYHYERFGINNVSDFTKNLAYLPSEILQGPTIGGIFDMPKLTDKFAVRASLDYLKFLASRKQTVNLEDGATASPMAVWLTAGAVYDWKPAWKITGDYQFTYAKTSWSGAVDGSMRPQMATSASRKDASHLLMLGLGHSF